MRKFKLGPWELRFARWEEFEQDDMAGDFSSCMVNETRKILERHGCSHGHDMNGTPPMFYPEAILCALHHQRTEGARIQRMLPALAAMAEQSRRAARAAQKDQ